ncbi:MAG: vanadium-dependent haloperoxidase [Deltaproteobacteria bacterium]|nr:vanadium-dependent haloperoxidase [Deltaproteobacteria bacterium]
MGSLPLQRRQDAYQLRQQAAAYQRTLPLLAHRSNGDDDRYLNRIASYTKGLPHNELGEVDADTYRALLDAVANGQFSACETIPLGGPTKLANPFASYAFTLEGADPHQVECRIPPTFTSAETAGEMVELYWQALTRDVQFSAYETHPLTTAAAEELAKCSDFRGPKADGQVTPATLFRGPTPGDLLGPYLSQFLWLDILVGTLTTIQKNRVTVSGDDHMTSYPEWLAIQRGSSPTRVNIIDPTPRYLHSGRGLAEYVHRDFTYQAYLHACLILLTMHAPLKADNPYTRSLTQSGFITFGAPHVLDLVGRVADAALKAAWCHKWLIHRRLRPEEFAGRIHNHLTNRAQYPLHAELLKAAVLDRVVHIYGSYLLPMAYPEGCPTHPAYPAGHAAIAGACTTILKAFFNESFIIPTPVMTIPDGLALVPYKGADLTVGGELNKLASNIALGRNTAGVHWRSDGIEGLKLGEAVAIGILIDLKATCPEPFDGFSFTKFDGTPITI